MSAQAFCKTKDIVLKQSMLPAGVCCKSALRPYPDQKGRLQSHTKPSHTTRARLVGNQNVAFDIRELPLGSIIDSTFNFDPSTKPLQSPYMVYSKEHVLLFNSGGEEEPSQKKKLALSIMYDNILREIPYLLDNHDYLIYAPDLEFVSHLPILRTVHGRQSYKVSLMTWFSSLKLLYTDLSIHLISSEKEEGYVTVRWGICGTARINNFHTRVFDGTSTFYPEDSTGLIKVHILDKVTVDKWKMYSQAPL